MDQAKPESDAEENGSKSPYQDSRGLLSKMRQQLGNGGTESELSASESLSFLPDCPVFISRARLGEKGGWKEERPMPMMEYSVYLDDQQSMADCTMTRPVTHSVTPVICPPCPFIPIYSSGATITTTVSPKVNPTVLSPMTDICGPFSSMYSPTGSAWDSVGSTSQGPVCSDRDPVTAAAHLHLLGESLSLIGHHLQETDKVVCTSSSLSLLLDSLLCALAPLICLTAQIPQLRSCTQHTLASTLENISYVMPGL